MRVLVLEHQEVMCSLGISGDGFYGYARTDEYGLSAARNKMLKEILRDYRLRGVSGEGDPRPDYKVNGHS